MSGVSTFAVLHYAGHGFAGWQRQTRERTVQAVFEDCLERLAGHRVVTHAAGRTDAGVHALGQVVSFRIATRWDPGELLRALRAVAPPDLWIAQVGRAPDGFHARRHATHRRYAYVVGCDPAAHSPFRRPFEWPIPPRLDSELLMRCARLFAGVHDFRAFSAAGQVKPHYRCHVVRTDWRPRSGADGFIFHIEADRFLHRMVRFMVGTMVDIARGRRPLSDVERLLHSTSNAETSAPAPPEGLFLVGARYPQLEEPVTPSYETSEPVSSR